MTNIRGYDHVVVIRPALATCNESRRKSLTQMRWLKHAPKRVGNHSLNNGVSWPDGDPQSLRDSV